MNIPTVSKHLIRDTDESASDCSEVEILSCTIYDYECSKNNSSNPGEFQHIYIKEEIPKIKEEEVVLSDYEYNPYNANFEAVIVDETFDNNLTVDNEKSIKIKKIKNEESIFKHNSSYEKIDNETTQAEQDLKMDGNNKLAYIKNVLETTDNEYKHEIKNMIKYPRRTTTIKSSLASLKKEKYEMLHMYKYSCWKCGFVYKLKSFRDRHELQCTMIPSLRCKFCPIVMDSVEAVRVHLINYHNFKLDKNDLQLVMEEIVKKKYIFEEMENLIMIICPKCNKKGQFTNENLKCKICKTQFIYFCSHDDCVSNLPSYDSLDALIYHARKLHLEQHVCKSCLWPFNTIEKLNDHKNKCKVELIKKLKFKELKFYCKFCHMKFLTQDNYKLHKCKCKGKRTQIFRCAHCRYRGSSKTLIESHLRYNHMHIYTGKYVRCKKCGTCWSSIFMLNDHLGNCSSDYEIECAKQNILYKALMYKI